MNFSTLIRKVLKQSTVKESTEASPQTHHIDVCAKGIQVDGVLLPEFTVTTFMNVFGSPRIVEPEGKEPDDRGIIPNTLLIWDKFGTMVYTQDGQTVNQFSVRLAEDLEWESSVKFDFSTYRPHDVYSGEFTLESKKLLDVIPEKTLRNACRSRDIRSGNWEATLCLCKAAPRVIESMEWRVQLREIASLIRSSTSPFREISVSCKPATVSTGKLTRNPSGWLLR